MQANKLGFHGCGIIVALALSGCVTTAQDARDGTNVALSQTAYVDGPRIKPVAILEDSRCPINARCMWKGRVRLKAYWIRATGNQEIELILDEAKPLADGTITLVSVSPKKLPTKQIKPQDYRLSFTFAGGL